MSSHSIPLDSFCWATGIENTFIPHTRPGLRPLDEYELTQHYTQWQADFDRVSETGVSAVRWGIPWYRVQPEPGRFDWRWVDEALDDLVNARGLRVILDLMHYGTPGWLENSFYHPDYACWVAEYAAAVADRYRSLVTSFTPLNEPMITAEFCGRQGVWPPYLKGEDGYLKIVLAVARGILETVRALRSVQPEAQTVQVEAAWFNWLNPRILQRKPHLAERLERGNLRQFLSYDLCTGRVDVDHPLYLYLLDHGVRSEELAWFRYNAVEFDIFGLNFYPWSYGEMEVHNGDLRRLPRHTPGSSIGQVISTAYQRYRQPIMVTETSANTSVDGRSRWMDETIETVCGLREQGVPVIGYTWFPLLTMINWDYRTGKAPLDRYLLHLGLYDSHFDPGGTLVRSPNPLLERFRQYTAQPVPALGSARARVGEGA